MVKRGIFGAAWGVFLGALRGSFGSIVQMADGGILAKSVWRRKGGGGSLLSGAGGKGAAGRCCAGQVIRAAERDSGSDPMSLRHTEWTTGGRKGV